MPVVYNRLFESRIKILTSKTRLSCLELAEHDIHQLRAEGVDRALATASSLTSESNHKIGIWCMQEKNIKMFVFLKKT